MAGRPDGGQGLPNQGENHQYAPPVMPMILLDQTKPQPRQIVPSNPIQEGFGNRLGQARYTDDETDGTQSLMYDNLDATGIQASPSQQVNVSLIPQPRASDVTSLSFTGNIQSASGFSDAALLNQPARGHPRPIQSLNTQLEGAGLAANTERIKENMKRLLGEERYFLNVARCLASFEGSRFGQEKISFAHQLLVYINDMCIKCFMCKETQDVGTQVRHKETCTVKGCYIETQNNSGNEDERRVELNGGRTNGHDQSRDQRLCILPPQPYSTEGERRPTDLATGGVLQAGVPLSEETLYKAGYIPNSFQTCNESSSFTRGYTTASGPPPNQTAQNVHLTPAVSESSARFPMYQRHDRRLRTFNNWQHNHVQCPKALTDAGFFYRETDDECQCFECGQVLRKWKVQDNPWTEHARHSPDCPFVMREKGEAFVNEVRKNTAKKEIRTPPTFFRTNAGRSEANPPRSNQAIITEDCSLLEMGFTKEQIQGAINRFRKVNGNKEYTTEHLIEMIISDENQEGNLMNQSICGACSRREVGVSQFKCGHIVCRKCAAQNIGDLCKICGKKVVKLVLFDAATLKK